MLSVLLICATLGADPAIDTSKETYTVAHAEMTKTGKPMLVLISTDWCPACQVMKHRILPTLRERLAFKRTGFAMVNPDQERDLSRQLIGNGPIPQMVLYRKTLRGWQRTVLVGSQSVEAVEGLITAGDQEDKPIDEPVDKSKAEKSKT